MRPARAQSNARTEANRSDALIVDQITVSSRQQLARMHAIFAQSLGEYGALGSLATGLQQLAYSIGASLQSVSATTWTIAAIAVLGLFLLMRR